MAKLDATYLEIGDWIIKADEIIAVHVEGDYVRVYIPGTGDAAIQFFGSHKDAVLKFLRGSLHPIKAELP
ncbi:MAG TPA: hypothetical protein VH518_24485 [Tepidisphaeraceae bacterium]|jgi:hypothetical protein